MPQVFSAAILICEKFLLEEDKVFSAIRIVDVSFVPKEVPQNAVVEINIVVLIKSLEPGDVRFLMRLIDPAGKEHDLKGFPETISLSSKFPDRADVPSGNTMGLRLNMKPDHTGTYFLKVLLDGVECAKTAFTLLEQAIEKHQS